MPREEPVHNEVADASVGNLVQARDIDQVNFHVTGQAAAPSGVPRQLLPPLRHFVDRVPQFDQLSSCLDADAQDVGPRVLVISGAPGVGKTALGTQWAHTVAGRFPDGQLYADLGGSAYDGAGDVGGVLHGFLRELGVHEQWIPASLDRRAALFRTKTAELKVLVMIRGVRYPAQVRQLMPGSPDGALLVTAGQRIGVLLTEGITDLELRPLDPDAGLLLLRRMVGDARVEADPAAAARLVELCDGLPLALRVAAARLAAHPNRPVRRLVQELAEPSARLTGLDAGDGLDVSRVFDAAADGLSGAAARAYRLLSLHPGPDFAVEAAAALLDLPVPRTGRVLDQLVESCLLGEGRDGRYRFHELIRLHARSRAERDEEPATCADAVERILRWYLAQAYRADWIALGDRLRVGGTPFDTPAAADQGGVADVAPVLADEVAALDWLETERANLLAAQRLAVDRGFDALAWRICEPLWALFLSRKYYADWIESHRIGQDAAARCGDPVGQAQAGKQLSSGLRELGRIEEAAAEAQQALELSTRAGHERLRASVLEALGKLHLARADLASAAAAFEESRAVNLRLGVRRAVLLQENLLGDVMLREGRHREAYELLSRVRGGMAELDERNQARVRINFGRAAEAVGNRAEAVEAFELAAAQYRRRGEPSGEIRALDALADLAAAVGDQAAQQAHLQRIIELYEAGAADERAEPYRQRLADLTP